MLVEFSQGSNFEFFTWWAQRSVRFIPSSWATWTTFFRGNIYWKVQYISTCIIARHVEVTKLFTKIACGSATHGYCIWIDYLCEMSYLFSTTNTIGWLLRIKLVHVYLLSSVVVSVYVLHAGIFVFHEPQIVYNFMDCFLYMRVTTIRRNSCYVLTSSWIFIYEQIIKIFSIKILN